MENNYKNNSFSKHIMKKFDVIYNLFLKTELINNANSENEKKMIKNMVPKIWNMDTQILTILNVFFEKILNVGFQKNDVYKLNIVKNQNGYKLIFNNENITPTSSKNKDEVAKNTMFQYVRVLSFFKVIIIKDYENLSRFFSSKLDDNKNYEVLLSSEFKLIYLSGSVNEWMTLGIVYDFIIKGIKDNNKDIMNMAFSFFVSTVYFLDKNKIIFNNQNDPKWSCIKHLKNKKINNIGYNNEIDKFKIIYKILSETYIQLVKKTKSLIEFNINSNNNWIINNENYDLRENLDNIVLHKFLDDILFLLFDKNETNFIIDTNYNMHKEFVDVIQLNNDIERCRQKLRENILKNRNKNNDTYYSDIESSSNEFNYLPDAIEQMEAAHILPVSDIKLKIKNNPKQKEEYLSLLSNENNGIIIDHVYHDAFDKNWLRLDYNGVFQPTEEWNKRYTIKGKIYKHGLVKIKGEVLSKEMKNFILLRK